MGPARATPICPDLRAASLPAPWWHQVNRLERWVGPDGRLVRMFMWSYGVVASPSTHGPGSQAPPASPRQKSLKHLGSNDVMPHAKPYFSAANEKSCYA